MLPARTGAPNPPSLLRNGTVAWQEVAGFPAALCRGLQPGFVPWRGSRSGAYGALMSVQGHSGPYGALWGLAGPIGSFGAEQGPYDAPSGLGGPPKAASACWSLKGTSVPKPSDLPHMPPVTDSTSAMKAGPGSWSSARDCWSPCFSFAPGPVPVTPGTKPVRPCPSGAPACTS